MNRQDTLIKMILSALFLALAYVMPFLTGQIPEIGSMLCPLHIPVILCGFICGWKYGLVIGLIAPLFRSLTLGMPPIFPTATSMSFELAAYGAISGVMYNILPKKKLYIYCSLLTAMIIGRIVWGVAIFICMGIKNSPFTFNAFVAGAFVNALPGIILQIVVIPVIIMTLEKINILKTEKKA